jgi:hypothetical protein
VKPCANMSASAQPFGADREHLKGAALISRELEHGKAAKRIKINCRRNLSGYLSGPLRPAELKAGRSGRI